MSHDLEAAWAGSELATRCAVEPQLFFNAPPNPTHVSAYAAKEGKNSWPHADGIIEITVTSGTASRVYNLAMEYKRPNEGLHGILTALGQAHAYIRKGYSGSAIIIPDTYEGLLDSGGYLRDVLDTTSQNPAIGVFTYSRPDPSKSSPFSGNLRQARHLAVDALPAPAIAPRLGKTETQWAHLREGSSDPDAFFRYLQSLKYQSGDAPPEINIDIPAQLQAAIERLSPGTNPTYYLSYASGNDLSSRAWRNFWFSYVLSVEMMTPWTRTNEVYAVNHVESRIRKSDGTGFKKFFSGRKDSNKEKAVQDLNTGTISENSAWEYIAQKFHDRAHSYREDIDSGLEYIEFIDSEGRMTTAGYRFLDACEKSANPNSGLPRALLLSALLQAGGLAGFLHYVHRLSDEAFSGDPLAFSERKTVGGKRILKFKQDEYLGWLEEKMTNELRVMRKVSARGGTARKPFQAELAILRSFEVVGKKFRIGVGLPINWPEIQRAIDFS